MNTLPTGSHGAPPPSDDHVASVLRAVLCAALALVTLGVPTAASAAESGAGSESDDAPATDAAWVEVVDGGDVYQRDGSSLAERLSREPGIWTRSPTIGSSVPTVPGVLGRSYALRLDGLALPAWMIDDVRAHRVRVDRTGVDGPRVEVESALPVAEGVHGGARGRTRAADASVGGAAFGSWSDGTTSVYVDFDAAHHEEVPVAFIGDGSHRRLQGRFELAHEFAAARLRLTYLGVGRRGAASCPTGLGGGLAGACIDQNRQGHAVALHVESLGFVDGSGVRATTALRRIRYAADSGPSVGLGELGGLGALGAFIPTATWLTQRVEAAGEPHEHLRLSGVVEAEMMDGFDGPWRGIGGGSLEVASPWRLGALRLEPAVTGRVEHGDNAVALARDGAAQGPRIVSRPSLRAVGEASTVASVRSALGLGGDRVYGWSAWQRDATLGDERGRSDQVEAGLRVGTATVDARVVGIVLRPERGGTGVSGLAAIDLGRWSGVGGHVSLDLNRAWPDDGGSSTFWRGPSAGRAAVSYQARAIPLLTEVGFRVVGGLGGRVVGQLDARLRAELGEWARVGFDARNLNDAHWAAGEVEHADPVSVMVVGELDL